MFLTSTSDIIRVVTGSAVSTIGVQAAWIDYASGSATPGRTNTAITSATTTTVVAAPAGSTTRNVRSLTITNNHATSSCTVAIQHYDGTTSVDIEKVTLLAGEQFVMAEDGEWRHLTAWGGEYEYGGPGIPNLGITGTVAETIPRMLCTELASTGAITSGQMCLQAIYLKAGMLVTNISFFSSGTAAGTPTHQLFGLYDRKMSLLAVSADDLTNAWAANTIKTLAMITPYTVPLSGIYHVAIMVAATTPPTLKCISASNAGNIKSALPGIRGATSDVSLTTELPASSASIPDSSFGSSTTIIWAAIT